MRLLGKVSMLRDLASATRTICDRRYVFVFGFRQQGPARWSVGAAQLGLDRLAQVLQEMEAVSDLPRLPRALSRALRI